mmetsp:Transcript_9291/g.17776  ORF Transcript_9291/g.17776 Transcript_9291/m.17776 type:complete len:81 (+) Transcript_9291:272-514(+)
MKNSAWPKAAAGRQELCLIATSESVTRVSSVTCETKTRKIVALWASRNNSAWTELLVASLTRINPKCRGVTEGENLPLSR